MNNSLTDLFDSDETLTGATTPGRNGPGSNGRNEEVFHDFHSFSIRCIFSILYLEGGVRFTSLQVAQHILNNFFYHWLYLDVWFD